MEHLDDRFEGEETYSRCGLGKASLGERFPRVDRVPRDGYSPVNFAFRFSRKAVMPSCLSFDS